MAQNKRKILVTNALTYANDSIHLGHMVGYVQADIWTRFQKMRGHECYYICGSDAHGTPIMLRAEALKVDPEALIEKIRNEQAKDCQDFLVDLDNYHTTHSEENRTLSEEVYNQLLDRGDIAKKTIEQAYDSVKNMFLPDRFVKGNCPRCDAPDQYGDSCEACGATYSPTELQNPISALSGTTPITKQSEHYFFQLPHYEKALRDWTKAGHLQEQVINKLEEWFTEGLKDWDISRDAPYFGFKIPNTKDKYFYVWMDAPIGYIASFKNFCEKKKEVNFDSFWKKENNDTELFHFIGKDIVYFHALFWPATLMGANLRTPTAIFSHGFLTINGEKMSKSRGTFIKARTYLDHLQPEYLRYYLAAKLSNRIEDIDLNLEDFRLRVNSDLIGKVVNIASRSAGFINKHFSNKLAASLENETLFFDFVKAGEKIADHYEQREYNKTVREIMTLADRANQYIDEMKPWKLIKDSEQSEKVHAICSLGLNLFRLLILYLKPILPNLSKQVETFLKISELQWDDKETPLLNHEIQPFTPLMQRIDEKDITAMLEQEKMQNKEKA